MEKTKRYDCEMPGWEENFIEVSTRWSRGDKANFWNLEQKDDDVWSELVLHKKIVSLKLERTDGEHLTEPSGFNAEMLRDTLPDEITTWLYHKIAGLILELDHLGEETRRQFYDTWASPVNEPVAAEDQNQGDAPASLEATDDTSAAEAQPRPPS